jgi:hypothetical protein
MLFIGLFVVGCGEGSSIEKQSIDLPNISKDKSDIYQKKCDKKGGCSNTDNGLSDSNSNSSSNDENQNSNDNSTQIDTNAPEQNRDIVSEPFGKIQDIFTKQYSDFPANTTSNKTENTIKHVVIDNNGVVHVIISHIASWINKQYKYNRHFQYYYVSYNPKTKKNSTPQKIFENKMLNDGNLPDESIEDFIIYDNKPIIVTLNSKNHTVKRYILDGTSKIIDTKSSGKVDSVQLINFNNKIYLIYRSLPDVNIYKNWRLKAIKVYPDLGIAHNIADEYLGLVRVNNNSIFSASEGIFYRLDSDMRAIELSKEEIGKPQKYLYGKINIYDSSVKELLLDDTFNIIILNQDNSKESIFQITDSQASMDNYRSHLITVSVYKDKVIIVYGIHTDTDKWKVVIFDRYTKDTTSTIIGYRIDRYYTNQPFIATNKDKRIVIGNIDGDYDYSAQLTVANIPNSKSEKEKILTEVQNIAWGYYTDKNNQRWYISLANGSNKVTVYSLMPIKNQTAGWGVVGNKIAKLDLDKDRIKVDNISNNSNGQYQIKYSDKSLNETIGSERIQSDIEKIRNSTVDIKWWFFSVDKSWYIINKKGSVYHFKSKKIRDNGVEKEDYDWQKVDLDDAVPTFFVENGVKKFRF